MKKSEEGKMEIISFDEFIDIITENRGDKIKDQIKLIEKTTKNDKYKN